jgi:hypothetical protein
MPPKLPELPTDPLLYIQYLYEAVLAYEQNIEKKSLTLHEKKSWEYGKNKKTDV